jgi:phosphatidylinositol alpha 1,6-mannosyltransferase
VTAQPQPRVALFCETFHEINGVALTARQLVAFAKRRAHPLLAVQSGERLAQFQDGNITRLELPRGWASFGIEHDLRYDLFLWRHLPHVRQAVLDFRPDVIHITSPGEFGQLGAWMAHSLRIPLVASWHTNLHQFAGRRLQKLLSFLPRKPLEYLRKRAERASLAAMVRFYRFARVTLAPTARQVRWLSKATRRPSFLMPRGVDCLQFHPGKRTVRDGTLRLGYVGRITPEKGVRLFVELEQALLAAGHRNFSIVVVGAGSEREWLQRNLKHATFTGILRGELLAEAYANMDLFIFPSRTDTFGNVVQEAAASAVPAVVSSEGGPQHLVTPGVTGLISKDDSHFIANVLQLASDRERLKHMGWAARQKVTANSWDAAFEMTYQAYRHCQPPTVLPAHSEPQANPDSSLPQRYCA